MCGALLLAMHTAHAACIALQASPEREGRNERRVAYGRVGLASAQIMYKRCAYSCTMRIHRIPVPLVHPLAPGPTARRVIYRLGGQMSSPVDYLSVKYVQDRPSESHRVASYGQKGSAENRAAALGACSICLQNGRLHPYIAKNYRCAGPRKAKIFGTRK